MTQKNKTNSQGSLNFHIQTVDINNSGSFNLEITIFNTSLFVGKKSSFSLEINLPILAEFESNSSKITSNQSVQFFFSGELGIAPNQYFWDFGDDQYSFERNPIHKYINVGNFTVELTIIDSKEHNDTIIKYNYIEVIANYQLLADFIWNASSIIKGQNISFYFIENSEISPAKFIWDFGDNLYSFERNPIHTYHWAGNFTIKLEIFDEFENSDLVIKENIIFVDIDKKPISHYFFIRNNDENGIFFMFKYDGIDGNCPITYYWDFGDGCYSNMGNVTHRFEGENSTYNVSLKIIDIDGDYSYFSSIIEVKSNNTLNTIPIFVIGCFVGSISVSMYIYKLYRKKRMNIFSLGDLKV
jgi:PKD repeat protein